jgi:hypothetical protein
MPEGFSLTVPELLNRRPVQAIDRLELFDNAADSITVLSGQKILKGEGCVCLIQ